MINFSDGQYWIHLFHHLNRFVSSHFDEGADLLPKWSIYQTHIGFTFDSFLFLPHFLSSCLKLYEK